MSTHNIYFDGEIRTRAPQVGNQMPVACNQM